MTKKFRYYPRKSIQVSPQVWESACSHCLVPESILQDKLETHESWCEFRLTKEREEREEQERIARNKENDMSWFCF